MDNRNQLPQRYRPQKVRLQVKARPQSGDGMPAGNDLADVALFRREADFPSQNVGI
jgi:hypothetical protein